MSHLTFGLIMYSLFMAMTLFSLHMSLGHEWWSPYKRSSRWLRLLYSVMFTLLAGVWAVVVTVCMIYMILKALFVPTKKWLLATS
jgi:hypothetical protein